MTKKIAVLVRDRQEEALRMSLGLTLMDDAVDVFMLGKTTEWTEQGEENLELMKEMGINLYSSSRGNGGLEHLSTEEIARRLVDYDHILPY